MVVKQGLCPLPRVVLRLATTAACAANSSHMASFRESPYVRRAFETVLGSCQSHLRHGRSALWPSSSLGEPGTEAYVLGRT